LLAAAFAVLMLAASCGSSASELQPYDSAQFAPIESNAVLEFANGDTVVSLTISDLEAIDLMRSDLYEPFVEGDTDFEGPSFEAVADSLGWPRDGTVRMLALNDYAYEMPLADLVGSQAMIATREHGEEIPIERGGPARIVFPDGTRASSIEDAWVWSLERLTLVG